MFDSHYFGGNVMNKEKLYSSISKSAIISAIIMAPINSAYAFQEQDVPRPIIVTTVAKPNKAAEVSEDAEVIVQEATIVSDPETIETDGIETGGIETLSDDELIDAELQAELDRIDRLDKLTNPEEFFKDFAMQRPLIELPTPDADKLVVANEIISQLFPVGTSERAIRTSLDGLIIPMIDKTLDLTILEAIELFGVPKDILGFDPEGDRAKEMANKKIGELMAEMEPKYREKMDIVFEAYAEITGLTSEPLEPFLAQAMARDYARKYDLAQLNDLKTFFATSTGRMFARDFMLSTASIDMVQTALKEFPVIAANSDKIQQVTKRIEEALKPEPFDFGDDVECDADDDACLSGDEVKGDIETALGADDLGNEPWFDIDNWDKETRENINTLEDTYNELAELSEQAFSQYNEAYEAAIAKSREKYIAEGWSRDDE